MTGDKLRTAQVVVVDRVPTPTKEPRAPDLMNVLRGSTGLTINNPFASVDFSKRIMRFHYFPSAMPQSNVMSQPIKRSRN